jgi:hypothetical protein
VIFRLGLTWMEVLEALRAQFPTGPAAAFHEFFGGGRRGFTLERRTPRDATVPLFDDTGTEATPLRKIG